MMSTESTVGIAPSKLNPERVVDKTGRELKRGAFVNTIALLAANFRGVFTFLIARLLGPAALGLFSVAWATTDVFSKIGIFGLDSAITTFIARAEAVNDRARSHLLYRLAVGLALVQSALIALLIIFVLEVFGDRLHLEREMVSALIVVVCAMPGIALYRISTSISRGLKVMEHDIFSRGLTEPFATTFAFLIALAFGIRTFGPEVAAIVGTGASGIVALVLAARLFRDAPPAHSNRPLGQEMRDLLVFAAPISASQFVNAFILRLDVMMLAWFIGRAPGVTLTTVGIYGAVVEVANGSRKVNQAFSPIFAPIVAGMTASGDQKHAAETYARLAQWMLWILLPLVAVLILAGGPILLIYGPAFQQGSVWLGIVAVACATNAFVNLGETAVMVQRPRLNLINSLIACIVAGIANLWLIPRFGVTGAALGVLIPYLSQGILRYFALRLIFRWPNPWRSITPPWISAAIAIGPALICRSLWEGIAGQICAALVFLTLFGAAWRYYYLRARRTNS